MTSAPDMSDTPAETDFARWIRGADDVDMEEVRTYAGAAYRIASTIDEALDLAATMARQMDEHSGLFGEWHPDPFVRGVLHGEAYAWKRSAMALNTWGSLVRSHMAVLERHNSVGPAAAVAAVEVHPANKHGNMSAPMSTAGPVSVPREGVSDE